VEEENIDGKQNLIDQTYKSSSLSGTNNNEKSHDQKEESKS
jgi:hypothetical protein